MLKPGNRLGRTRCVRLIIYDISVINAPPGDLLIVILLQELVLFSLPVTCGVTLPANSFVKTVSKQIPCPLLDAQYHDDDSRVID